jgi:intraflagellar transport protein 122
MIKSLTFELSSCSSLLPGYYYWLLATEVLKNLQSPSSTQVSKEDQEAIGRFYEYQEKAEIYYAYHSIYRYTDEPFTSLLPDALFQTAQYILNHTKEPIPHGISKVYTLFALAKQGKVLGAFKLARQAYTKLLGLKMPASWKDQIDLACLTVRTKPYSDEEGLLPVCYRCSTSNPLLNNQGDSCINCHHLFIRSFCSFETLPLVQFEVENGISDEDAVKYLDMDPSETVKYGGVGAGGKKKDSDVQTNINVMSLEEDPAASGEDGAAHPDDDFQQQLHHFESDHDGNFPPIRVGIKGLVAMKREEVFVRRWEQSKVMKFQYFRSVIPDLPITLCPHCNHFFHEEDFEFHALQKKNCPYVLSAHERDGLLLLVGWSFG